ncbi:MULTISPECIES: transposase [Kribbella]|uniref:transposase n=1 Tax=Kribbella TaxID=182639 RepID=UPI0013051A80
MADDSPQQRHRRARLLPLLVTDTGAAARAGLRRRARWTIEESFHASKTLTGLDQHQVRRWDSWHRWTILAMLAYAFLAVLTAPEPATTSADRPSRPKITKYGCRTRRASKTDGGRSPGGIDPGGDGRAARWLS